MNKNNRLIAGLVMYALTTVGIDGISSAHEETKTKTESLLKNGNNSIKCINERDIEKLNELIKKLSNIKKKTDMFDIEVKGNNLIFIYSSNQNDIMSSNEGDGFQSKLNELIKQFSNIKKKTDMFDVSISKKGAITFNRSIDLSAGKRNYDIEIDNASSILDELSISISEIGKKMDLFEVSVRENNVLIFETTGNGGNNESE